MSLDVHKAKYTEARAWVYKCDYPGCKRAIDARSYTVEWEQGGKPRWKTFYVGPSAYSRHVCEDHCGSADMEAAIVYNELRDGD